ncbi:MAG: hypothetical protein ACRDZW_11330 [Acidimicrobiales bacterium]
MELKDHVSKNRSFAVTARLEERLDASCAGAAERLELFRALRTAGLELQDRADDLFGNMGQLRQEAWATYLGLDVTVHVPGLR